MPLLMTVMAVVVMVVAAADQPTVLVTLNQGDILGSREEAANGCVYYSFNTIPYAKPPVGHLRLKDPEPAPAWTGIRSGSLPFPKCPQTAILTNQDFAIQGQEDCLYLNVYTPKPNRNSNLPVMVYIHGGAFVAGFAMGPAPSMIPAPMMQNDVIVVAMNYRLGALGFLSTGDSVLPGNLGIKDQTLALHWVQDNIREFGGDPNQVTIFGVSAGGTSCHIHMLSPRSAGLFQRAILQSGSALINHVFAPPREGAISVSKTLNCTGEESHQLLECFMKASALDLVYAQSVAEWYGGPLIVGVHVDGTVLPDSPAALIKSGRYNKVDVIIGCTKDDGDLITAGLFSKGGEKSLQELNENFEKVGPILLETMEEEDPVYLARHIFFNYMDDLNVTLDDEPALTSLLRDAMYEMPGVQAAEFHAKDRRKKTFIYRLEHYLEKSHYAQLTNTYIQRQMSGHSDDNIILFTRLTRPQDLHVQTILATLWTNFAATGNPTVNGELGFRWTPVTHKEPLRYLAITASPTMKLVDRRTQDFWNSLPTKTAKQLYPKCFLPDNHPDCTRDMLRGSVAGVLGIKSALDDLQPIRGSGEFYL